MSQLFYEKPAQLWEEALPIGNGRIGAMVFGGIQNERLQLNEDSIWYGGPIDRLNKDALPNLGKVQRLILDKNISEAEELLKYSFSGNPQSQRPYQSLGDLSIRMKNHNEFAEDYKRELSLDDAIMKTTYKVKGVTYKREYFISEPDQVIVIRFTSNKKGSISFDALMTRERFFDQSKKVGPNSVMLEGNLGKGGVDFCVALKAEVISGNVQVLGEHLLVSEADEAILYLSVGTTFYDKDYKTKVLSYLEKAAKVEYEELKRRHMNDYQRLYKRVKLSLAYDKELDKQPTDMRLKKVCEGFNDNGLTETYFNLGRYLLISSSREGSLPANLQGIWNKEMLPSWDSKFTININLQMNYWLAEVCNLSECHTPLFDLIKRVAENGKKTARDMYGCRGFVAHHNTDLWADTLPQDIYIPSTFWVMGGAWLCTHLWTHYEYTMNEEWLKEIYPIIKEAVLFFMDFLIEENGEMIICPSVSPENTYILPDGTRGCVCAGSSMDTQILKDLFTIFIQSAQLLDLDQEFVAKVKLYKAKLPQIKVGKYGQIMEWREDYEEADPGHRHISQLYALHPSHQISMKDTPELAEAAKKTLMRRLKHGGGHTGWSCAWIINFYARLYDGEKAYENFIKLLKGSTYISLLDNHPLKEGSVFQIDGNLGACAAIAEMLIQSDSKRIVLLPALPSQWQSGSIRGLCVRGAGEVSIEWVKGKLIKAQLVARHDLMKTVHYQDKQLDIAMKAGESKTLSF